MTIYKVIPKVNKDEKNLKDFLEVPLTDKESEQAVRVTLYRSRSRLWLNIFLIMLGLLVLVTGITGGYYLYKHHLSSKVRRGHCKFVIAEESFEMPTPLPMKGKVIDNGGLFVDHETWARTDRKNKQLPVDSLEWSEDITVEDQVLEEVKMPRFADILDSLVLHDFERNYTAIVDFNDARCFIMNLNRSEVAPPHSVLDLISKILSGYYLPRVGVLHKKYRVMTPALEDIKFLGPYIVRKCFGLDTFMLERMTDAIVKRSAQNNKVFGYYESKMEKLIRYELQNVV